MADTGTYSNKSLNSNGQILETRASMLPKLKNSTVVTDDNMASEWRKYKPNRLKNKLLRFFLGNETHPKAVPRN